jgi:hypothetical protein
MKQEMASGSLKWFVAICKYDVKTERWRRNFFVDTALLGISMFYMFQNIRVELGGSEALRFESFSQSSI